MAYRRRYLLIALLKREPMNAMQVLADPLLSRFFIGISIERLKAHQVGGRADAVMSDDNDWGGAAKSVPRTSLSTQ